MTMTSLLRLACLASLVALGIAFSWQMDAHPHDGWCGYSCWFLACWTALLLWGLLACGNRRSAGILAVLAVGGALAAWGMLQQGVTPCSWGDVANVAGCAAGLTCFAWVLRRYLLDWRATARACRRAELALPALLLLGGLVAACLNPGDAEVRARLAESHPTSPAAEWDAAQHCYRVQDTKGWQYLYNASGEFIRTDW